MDKFKVAKSLLKIAKMLVSGKDTYEEDLAQYNENIKDKASLDGVTVGFDHDDIVFTYNGDETGSCRIVFGEVEGFDWGYTVFIDGEAVSTSTMDHPNEAYETLQRVAKSYVRMMDKAIAERVVVSQPAAAADMGTCSISEISEKGIGGKGNAFQYMMMQSREPAYEVVFTPSGSPAATQSSLKSIASDLDNMMPVSWKKGSNVIKFQPLNKNDVEYVKGVIKSAGWTI